MSPWHIALILAIPVTLPALLYLCLHRTPHHKPPAPAGILRPGAEYTAGWLRGFSHAAPERPLTVERAHLEWQRHMGCTTDMCARRAAALNVLVDNKKIVLDTSRQR